MGAINTQKQLLDTIESLENRINKHSEVIYGLKEIIKRYNGSNNKDLSEIAKYIESLIEKAYK